MVARHRGAVLPAVPAPAARAHAVPHAPPPPRVLVARARCCVGAVDGAPVRARRRPDAHLLRHRHPRVRTAHRRRRGCLDRAVAVGSCAPRAVAAVARTSRVAGALRAGHRDADLRRVVVRAVPWRARRVLRRRARADPRGSLAAPEQLPARAVVRVAAPARAHQLRAVPVALAAARLPRARASRPRRGVGGRRPGRRRPRARDGDLPLRGAARAPWRGARPVAALACTSSARPDRGRRDGTRRRRWGAGATARLGWRFRSGSRFGWRRTDVRDEDVHAR